MGGGDAGTAATRWPLVGRDDELALAAEALAKHRSVVLTGPAGVGKNAATAGWHDVPGRRARLREWSGRAHPLRPGSLSVRIVFNDGYVDVFTASFTVG